MIDYVIIAAIFIATIACALFSSGPKQRTEASRTRERVSLAISEAYDVAHHLKTSTAPIVWHPKNVQHGGSNVH